MSADSVLLRRVVALLASVAAVVALVGTGVTVGQTVAPWAGWLVVLVVSGLVVVRVGGQVLDDQSVARDRKQLDAADPIHHEPTNGQLVTMPERPSH